ncbi:MAG: AGE family epimerase/isomerase, partial [Acetobacteraceae bacterium]
GTLREPGHQFEWFWLLARYRALCPDGRAVPAGAPLGFGLAGGIDPRDGLAFDAIGPDLQPRETSKRLWPQTELLKALLPGLAARPSPARAARIDRVCRAVTARYRSARGLWHDRLDPSGAPIEAPVPASTLYHLFVAATELRRHRGLLAPA